MKKTLGRASPGGAMIIAYIKPGSVIGALGWPLWVWGVVVFCAILLLALLAAGIDAVLQSEPDQ